MITTKSIGNLEKDKFVSIISHQFHAPSLNHAGARPGFGMFSLRRGGMVIRRQIPTKFIPTQPDSNIKSVNITIKFFVHYAVSGRCPA